MDFFRYNLALLLLIFSAVLRIYAFCEKDVVTCQNKMLSQSFSMGEHLDTTFETVRHTLAKNTRRYFPSPHSELVLGMTLGIDDLKKVPKFSEALRRTGTIHVVVVSGYNISLVFGIIINIIGTQYKRHNLVVAQGFTLLYALLSGFDPPVIRSWIMGSIVACGKYYGRQLLALRVLFFSGALMVLINPLFLYSLSFQLSFLATLSLVLYSSLFTKLITKIISAKSILLDDLVSTLAAQVLVWPLLAYRFNQVSLISPLINCLILWTVPLATVLGGVFLFISLLGGFVAAITSYLVYVPLDIFVTIVQFFSKFSFSSVNFSLSLNALLFYYLLVLGVPLLLRK